MIILVDQDGVLADFDGGIVKLFRQQYPKEFFVPLEKRKHFYTEEDYSLRLRKKVIALYHQRGFCRNLEPMPGAINGIRNLVKIGHQVLICTTPLTDYENCVLEKYQWVDNHLGRDFTKRIIFTKDKTLIHGDILIDDKPEIKGAREPVWEHFVFDRPYNRHVNGKIRVTWETIEKELSVLCLKT